ncbi:carbon storage regulator [Planctomycetes bacterium CA13]|uniref:carbon storage regulator n=1 Tax=Novipirellula herctigrandis TaxID=2527986 RepID=UPI0011B4DD47
MLVLSRKENDSIVINGNITIVVARIQGGKVRLGIEAPQDVPIHRQEVKNGLNRDTTEKTLGGR